jgi:hypothetical protein
MLVANAALWLMGNGPLSAIAREYNLPPPGGSLIGVMTEAALDDLVTAMATALRESSLAQSATRTRFIAPPGWINATDIPFDRPAEFIDALTERINARCGANVQFLRRPWVMNEMSPEEAVRPSDYPSRLTLLPPEKKSDRRLRLRLEIFAPGGSEIAFSHTEEFDADEARLTRARRDDRQRETILEEARIIQKAEHFVGGEVRFASSSLTKSLGVSGIETRPIGDGRLDFRARVISRRGNQRVLIQAYFYDAEGHAVEVSRPLVRRLSTARQTPLRITSQLPAVRCLVMFEKI